MIYKGTKVSIDDYSGAAFGKCINIFGGSYVSHANAGKFILITLRVLRFIKRLVVGTLIYSLVTKISQWSLFLDGSLSKFRTNSVISTSRTGKMLAGISEGVSRVLFSSEQFLKITVMTFGLIF